MYFLLNDFITTGLSEKKISKKVSMDKSVDIVDIFQAIDYIKENNTGKDVDIQNINSFLDRFEDIEREFYKQLLIKNLKIGVSASTWNKITNKDLQIPVFNVMLAHKFEDHRSKVKGSFILTKKLDGTRIVAIKENYTISSRAVTQKMVDDAQNSIDKLLNLELLEDFNKELLNLFKIIPRKMSYVGDYLAKESKDYREILAREQDLLDVMKGQVVEQSLENSEEDVSKIDKTILEVMGIEIQPITKQESVLIKQQLGDVSDKYADAWKVVNIKTQKRYDDFINNHNIKDVRMLWHGTRSENVWSILNTGLALRPNAVITGKMFGHGIYFAPKARKSLGYTSLSGSYWAKGGQNEGYMLLFDVAYGKPYNVYDFNSKFHDLSYEKLQQFELDTNCLHAHSSKGMLRNDEIIVYKEEQVTVKYLVELKEN